MSNSVSLMPLVWLAVIVLAIPAVLWLVRSSGLAGLAPLRTLPGGLRVLSQTLLAPQQRLVMVEVGEGLERCHLLLGVTPQQMSVLHRIDLPVGVSPAAVTDAASGDLSGTALPVVPVAPAGLDDGSFHRMIDQWRRGTPGAAPRHQGS